MSKTHHLTRAITEDAKWICSCGDWAYTPRNSAFTFDKLKAAFRRHAARFNGRKAWRVPGVGEMFKCPQCGNLIVKNRRDRKFCSRKCAAQYRYSVR